MSGSNVWRDIVQGQAIDDLATAVISDTVTERGAESYALPDFENMDQLELARRQEVVNESLKRVVASHGSDLFGPSDDCPVEYGTARRFNGRTVPSDRIPVASAELERMRQIDPNYRRKRFNVDNSTAYRQWNQQKNSDSSSTNKKARLNKKGFGSKSSIASDASEPSSVKSEPKSSRPELPIPYALMKEGYSEEVMQSTVLDENLTEEEFGAALAEALGEENPEMILYSVKKIGTNFANRLFKKTQEIERNGGMHVDNQSRRRTPGGVFIKLIRSDKVIPAEIRNDIRDFGSKLFQQKAAARKESSKEELPSLPSAVSVVKPMISPDA